MHLPNSRWQNYVAKIDYDLRINSVCRDVCSRPADADRGGVLVGSKIGAWRVSSRIFKICSIVTYPDSRLLDWEDGLGWFYYAVTSSMANCGSMLIC